MCACDLGANVDDFHRKLKGQSWAPPGTHAPLGPAPAARVGSQTGDRGSGFGRPVRGTSLGEKKRVKVRASGRLPSQPHRLFRRANFFFLNFLSLAGRGGQGWSGLACTARRSEANGVRFTFRGVWVLFGRHRSKKSSESLASLASEPHLLSTLQPGSAAGTPSLRARSRGQPG